MVAAKNRKSNEKSVEIAESSAPTDPFGRWAMGDWIDRFPAMFGRRWPEMWSQMTGVADTLRVEELVEDDACVVRAEIPGVDPEKDIEIIVESGQLSISAERKRKVEEEEAGRYRSEFHYGSFRRTMSLPAGADADDVVATYEDGILEVRVPVDRGTADKTRIAVARKS